MKIAIAGGTGLLGQRLVRQLVNDGHDVVVLSRSSAAGPGTARIAVWNGRDPGPWTEQVAEADAVINLSGASIGAGRWTRKRKELIRDSRRASTRAIVEALRAAPRRQRVLVNASAVGFYGSVEDGEVEETHPPGGDFLANVCREWEAEAQRASDESTRVVILRTGMVLDPSGGALAKLATPFRFFVGGPLGSGRQWMPWIHYDDMARAVIHCLSTPGLSGPVNLTSPHVVRMKEFCEILGGAMRRPSWMPVPAVVLRLILGEMSGIVLTGQCAVPKKLEASGFRHRFPRLEGALQDIVGG